ncbi:MAG: hypothetical protein R3313_03975 [Candidatus Saccharimonadales bacterium]|nr:hypothetical protein [Candidatus Saccharimonadales bacterium]
MDVKPPKAAKPKASKPLEFAEDQPVQEEVEEQQAKAVEKPVPNNNSTPDKKEPRGSKWLMFIILLLLIGALAAGGWYLFLRDDSPESTAQDTEQQNTGSAIEAPQVPAPAYLLDQVVYAFGVSFESVADVYLRPAAGGDRESVYDLKKIGAIDWGGLGSPESFVQSEKFAFVVDYADIYIGEANKKPEKVYSHPDASADDGIGIQSVVISPDGSRLAFSVVPTGLSDPQVWTVGTDGSNAAMLIESAKIGPLQWSTDNTKLMLGPNILGAGARLDNPQVVNVETGESVVVIEPATSFELSSFAFSADGTKFAYIKATADESRATDDIIGYYVGKPYEVHWIDLTTGEDSKVASINENDGPTSVSWQHGEDTFLYSIGNRLVEIDIETGQSTNLYETTTSDVINVIYASDGRTALVGSLEDDFTYTVYSIDLEKKDRTEVMQTTDSTVGVGILLK